MTSSQQPTDPVKPNDHQAQEDNNHTFASLKVLKRKPRRPLSPEEQQRRKMIQKALNWLCETFPQCFNFQQPKPLQTKIEKDIFGHLPKDQSIARLHIRKVLNYYTTRTSYQKAFLENTQRFNLQGEPVEDILAFHKDYVVDLLVKKEDRKKKKEGQGT